MATGEPARALRFVNVPLGAWVAVAPWLFGGPATVSGVAAGALLILLSTPRGQIRDRYGFWQRYIA